MAEGLGREEGPSHGLIFSVEDMIDRLSFGFHNPNHAAALACALLPLCFGWRHGPGAASRIEARNPALKRKVAV